MRNTSYPDCDGGKVISSSGPLLVLHVEQGITVDQNPIADNEALGGGVEGCRLAYDVLTISGANVSPTVIVIDKAEALACFVVARPAHEKTVVADGHELTVGAIHNAAVVGIFRDQYPLLIRIFVLRPTDDVGRCNGRDEKPTEV